MSEYNISEAVKLKNILATAPHTGWCKSTFCSNMEYRGIFGKNDYVFPTFPVFKFDIKQCDCWKKEALESICALQH